MIWLVSHLTTIGLVSEYLLDKGLEAFAALMGMGMWFYGSCGILASYFVAKITRRNWAFFVCAAVVGPGVGIYILAAHYWGVPSAIVDTVAYAFLGLAFGGVVMVLVRPALQPGERARRRARDRASPSP